MSDEARVESGMIYIGGLLSWQKLSDWAFLQGYDEWVKSWMQPQWFAWLLVLLRELPDDADMFTHGKWATIQRMEGLIAAAAKIELRAVEP
jgi:hypothetical protein